MFDSIRRRGSLLAVLTAALLVSTLTAPALAEKPPPEQVTVLGPFAVGSPEADALEAELTAFAEKRVEVIYEEHFGVADLIDRITGTDPPDVIISAQPTAIEALANELVDLGEFVDARRLRRDFGDHLIDLATVDGVIVGAPIKADLKSLVWYQPDDFVAGGYAIPETFDELVALSDQMVADGRTPWCNYMESGFATGWLGTDWVEDLLLGAEGPQVYDQWVNHEILFVDPRVEAAFERFISMVDTAGYVFDRPNLTNFFFFFNAVPLGDGDCMMHRQAAYFAGALQSFGYDLAEFAAFKFPSVDQAFGDFAVGGGVYVAAVNERQEVRRLVRFMLSPRFGRTALTELGGWVVPNVRFDTTRYADELTRSFAEIIEGAIRADQYRFDASDLMPPEVGTGEFWFAIRDLVDGVRLLPDILADIDAAWPN